MKTREELELDCELCNYCDWNKEGNINSNEFNICEGGNCDEAYQNYLDEQHLEEVEK